MSKINIAIDGYSACGKSTMAKALANELGYVFVDTGAMYRAVTLFALRNQLIAPDVEDWEAKLVRFLAEISIGFRYDPELQKSVVLLNNENVEVEIREQGVSAHVSRVAALPEVRKKLVEQQQEMGRDGGCVMDGRDIGTVVFPQAALKLFVTADKDVRTQRRYDELMAKGAKVTFEEVSKNLEERDRIDTTRKDDPLRQADDAVLIDNTNLNREEQIAMVLALARLRSERA